MPTRKIDFSDGEIYHLYNRGVEKRDIFESQDDLARFMQSMIEFNAPNAIGSLYENSFLKLGGSTSKSSTSGLISFICYCLNPNHYHFLVRQESEKGIEKFMQRLGTGYTMYFNNKNKRCGALFQGKFKAVHVDTNEYLTHLSAYINLNDKVHQLGGSTSKLSWTSWDEYIGNGSAVAQRIFGKICQPDIILDQFDGPEDYKKFAEESLLISLEQKDAERELKMAELE